MSNNSVFDPSDINHEHPDVNGGWFRPAIFGAMDGLVSNFALIMGVAGGTIASDSTQPVILAGFAGLAAGAFSMAAGEYTSVASQSELAREQVAVERREIELNSEAEEAELTDMFMDQGVELETARIVAAQIHRDPEIAVKVHSMIEMGIDPDDLASPKVAAVSSFFAFALGAVLPLLPYVFGVSSPLISIVVSLIGLFVFGVFVTRVTSVAWWFGGLRQLILGAAAAGLTYVIGMWVGGGL